MRRTTKLFKQKQAEEKPSSLPVKIVPIASVDRLIRVKDWVRIGRAPIYNNKRFKFHNKVAEIIADTYAECGDAAVLPDDIALMRIRDLLLELDEGIIRSNKKYVKAYRIQANLFGESAE